MMTLWLVGTALYFVLAFSTRRRFYCSLFKIFIVATCLRSVIRLVFWLWFPALYRPTYWPGYWALFVLGMLAAWQAFRFREQFVTIGFVFFYWTDFGLRFVPTVNDGVRIIKMLPAIMAALWWLYGERHNVNSF